MYSEKLPLRNTLTLIDFILLLKEIFFIVELGVRRDYVEPLDSFGSPMAAPIGAPTFPNGTIIPHLLQQIDREFEIYVAVVVPKHIGGRVVKYEVCREVSNGEDCSEEGNIALFGLNGDISQEKTVNSSGFTIQDNLFLPSWDLSQAVDAIRTWTRIEVSDGSDLVPPRAPFFVYRFTSDLGKVAHLPVDVRKEQYGDLLDDYSVRSYCGSYNIEDRSWNLGHPSICPDEH